MWPWFSILHSLSLKSNASLQLCRLYLLSKNRNIYLHHLNTMSLIAVTSFNNLTLNTSSGILFKILNMWQSLHVFAFLSPLTSNPSSFSLVYILWTELYSITLILDLNIPGALRPPFWRAMETEQTSRPYLLQDRTLLQMPKRVGATAYSTKQNIPF